MTISFSSDNNKINQNALNSQNFIILRFSPSPILPFPPSYYYGFYYLCPNFLNNSKNNNYLIQWGNGFLNIKVLISR
jgi:hypothetical protein